MKCHSGNNFRRKSIGFVRALFASLTFPSAPTTTADHWIPSEHLPVASSRSSDHCTHTLRMRPEAAWSREILASRARNRLTRIDARDERRAHVPWHSRGLDMEVGPKHAADSRSSSDMTAITSRPDAQGKSRSHQGVGFGSTYECQLLRYSPRGISSERTQALNRLAHAVSSELSSSISQRTIWSARIFRNTLGACPSIRSCFRIVPWFSLGLCLLASAQPSAHYPPSTRSGAVGAAPNLQKIVCQADQLPLG